MRDKSVSGDIPAEIITPPPTRVTVNDGERLEIKCTVGGDPKPRGYLHIFACNILNFRGTTPFFQCFGPKKAMKLQ